MQVRHFSYSISKSRGVSMMTLWPNRVPIRPVRFIHEWQAGASSNLRLLRLPRHRLPFLLISHAFTRSGYPHAPLNSQTTRNISVVGRLPIEILTVSSQFACMPGLFSSLAHSILMNVILVPHRILTHRSRDAIYPTLFFNLFHCCSL